MVFISFHLSFAAIRCVAAGLESTPQRHVLVWPSTWFGLKQLKLKQCERNRWPHNIWQHMTMSLKISDNTFGWFQWSLIGWLCQVSGMKTRNDVSCTVSCPFSPRPKSPAMQVDQVLWCSCTGLQGIIYYDLWNWVSRNHLLVWILTLGVVII